MLKHDCSKIGGMIRQYRRLSLFPIIAAVPSLLLYGRYIGLAYTGTIGNPPVYVPLDYSK